MGAQELANTQQAAATAVATVSIHFRKKLNFWLKLEEMIEEAFKSALDTNEALQDQKERSFLNSNYANTAVHDPKTYEYTVGNRAKITNGAQYNDNAGRTASGEAEAEPGHEFTSQYSGAGNNNDAERKHEFVSSNLAIETTIVCAAANCGASKQSFYPADFSTFDADEDNCECNSLVYQNEDYPALNRQAQCKVEQGNDEGVCVIGDLSILQQMRKREQRQSILSQRIQTTHRKMQITSCFQSLTLLTQQVAFQHITTVNQMTSN